MMKATPVTRSPLVLVLAVVVGVLRRMMLGRARAHRATPQRLGALMAVTALLCALLLPAPVRAAPADNWTAVAPMTTTREGLAAVTGPDGRIYALGGCCGSDGVLATVEA